MELSTDGGYTLVPSCRRLQNLNGGYITFIAVTRPIKHSVYLPRPVRPDGFPQLLMARTLRFTGKYAQQARFEHGGYLTGVKILRIGEANVEIADL